VNHIVKPCGPLGHLKGKKKEKKRKVKKQNKNKQSKQMFSYLQPYSMRNLPLEVIMNLMVRQMHALAIIMSEGSLLLQHLANFLKSLWKAKATIRSTFLYYQHHTDLC
jgi:hypothetical protein